MLHVMVLFMFCGTAFAKNEKITMLVNRVKLYKEDYNSNIKYRYFDGDAVDVACYSLLNSNCRLTIGYDYIDNHPVPAGTNKTINPIDSFGVGVRLTLQAAHNNSRVSCKCLDDGPEATADVTFVLEDTIDDVMNLKINGLRFRPQNMEYSSEYVVVYRFGVDINSPKQEQLIFECGTNNDNIALESYQYECGCRGQSPIKRKFSPSTTGARLVSDYSKYLKYLVRNKTETSPIQTVDFSFEALILPFLTIRPSLTVNKVPENKNLMTIYSHGGGQLIYYFYEEGDLVNITCTCKSYSNFILDGTDKRGPGSITKLINLTTADHSRTVNCCKPKRFKPTTQSVVFLKGTVAATTTGGIKTDSPVSRCANDDKDCQSSVMSGTTPGSATQ